MITSQRCIELIKSYEGYSSKAYLCPAQKWTLGYGSTMYKDGSKVKQGDTITKEAAEELLRWEVETKAQSVKAFLDKVVYNQNQMDSLVSFTYNVGVGNFQNSTLLKKVRRNPKDETIKAEFLRWNKATVGGKLIELPGLTKRRMAEANLYFTK